MNDNAIRHMIAALAVIVCLLAYYAGYYSGGRGWWFTVFSLAIVYGGVYKLIDK